MSRAAAERLTGFILGVGVAIAVAVYLWLGQRAGWSSAIGVVLSVANWYLLRYIVARVVEGGVKRQSGFAFVLLVKLGGMMGLIYWLLQSGIVEPISFTLGVSALVVGVLLGSFVHVLTASAVESEH